MRCVNIRHRQFVDPVSGVVRTVDYPCGHCTACLHNQQDSWAIRINETAKRCMGHRFIYDTLTFSPKGMEYKSVEDELSNPLRKVSAASLNIINSFTRQYEKSVGETGVRVVPNIHRGIIRDWIRRGRELYFYDHGVRPKWKYVIFMEFGPATSRPHFHLLFFNILFGDYIHYLAEPWRRERGFTKTILVSNETKKHRQCISRYISKYCSKGVFESPLCKDGLVDKPFRSISHGIGEEYLDNSIFDWYRSDMNEVWKQISVNTSKDDEVRTTLLRSCKVRHLVNDVDLLEGFEKPSDTVLSAITTYIDEGGFIHSLPRYYKHKLLNLFAPNLFSYAIQNLLLESTELYNNKKMAEFAYCLGGKFRQAIPEAPYLGLSKESFDLLGYYFASFEAQQARIKSKRRYIELKNHYKRPLQSVQFAWAS